MDETDRWWRNTAILVGFLLPVLLFFPIRCWAAECPAGAMDCMSDGCDSVLGLTMHDPGTMTWLAGGGAVVGAVLLGTIAHRILRDRGAT